MNRIFIPAFIFALLTLAALPAQALLERDKYSESDRAGFAFYSLGKIKPRFEEWVKASDAYINASPANKSTILNNEMYRLEQGFYNFTPDEDPIHVRAEVTLLRPDSVDGTKIKIQMENHHGDAIFPVIIGSEWLAVTLIDSSAVATPELDPGSFLQFLKKSGFESNDELLKRKAVLDLWLRPVSANVTAPTVVNGIAMWQLMADVGSATLMDETQSVVLWQMDAPWFEQSERKNILDLYKD